METADITIIGAGVIGLAVAAHLARDNKEVIVLEKHPAFGQETSSRNSEVIHSGLYYPEDSLKARLCIRGNKLLYRFCQEHDIRHSRTGKLIVAVDKTELGDLEELLNCGRTNGVEGLKILSQGEIKKTEPHIRALKAVYVPSTGIIDTHQLMKTLESAAGDKGAVFAYGCEVRGIERENTGYQLSIRDTDGHETNLISRIVVNCAGLSAHLIAKMAGIDIDALEYNQHYCKGEYFRVSGSKSKLISHLIYPVPEKAGLGVHTVIDLQGQLRLGPNTFYVDELNYDVDPSHKQEFYESVKKFMPFIEPDDLSPDTAGIRAKLQGPGEEVKDFVICSEAKKGYPGFINLIGIESPGLTSCLSIAEYVSEELNKA